MINPHSREGHKFIIIAIEFTTKWVKSIPMKLFTQSKILAFLTKNIIVRFGVPQMLIMKNGPNFKGKDMKEFCKKFYISQTFFSIYHPKNNGQDKATNRTIKSIINCQNMG